MRPGDLIVVAFVENQAVGMRFKEWPLHVTVLSWLRGNLSGKELVQKLELSLFGFHSFEAKVAAEDDFGTGGSVLVNLIQKPSLLEEVFKRTSEVAQAAKFKQVSKRYPEYRPHVTVQKSARMHEGATFQVDRLYVVRQRDAYKEVEAEIHL